jgi:hypothetical protein
LRAKQFYANSDRLEEKSQISSRFIRVKEHNR